MGSQFFGRIKREIGVLQGIAQGVSLLASEAHAAWMVIPFDLALAISVVGIASAWLSGSARILFVAGLDSYLPEALGRLHPKYATPYVALLVHATCSAILLAMSFAGAGVKEAFVTMLDLAVVQQLIPFLYIYAALLKLARRESGSTRFSKAKLVFAGSSGLASTILGMCVAFVPSHQIRSIGAFEAKMVLGSLALVGLAAFFFCTRIGAKSRAPVSRSVSVRSAD